MPTDDGAADHLPNCEVPATALPSTLGGDLATAAAERLVVYVYPRTGVPGEPLLPGWDDIPGARGCTPQSCAPTRACSSRVARCACRPSRPAA